VAAVGTTARGARVKGTLLSVAVESARQAHAGARADLSEASRQMLEGVVLASVWYPLAILDELLAWLTRDQGPGASRAIGASAAVRDLKGVYRSFLRAGDPAATLAALPVVWSLYHDSGSAQVERPDAQRAEITVRGFARPSRALCDLTTGWLQQAAEHAGGRRARADERRCRLHHDDRCHYVVAWDLASHAAR
jgi:hypothetical protein